jgi:hypothetical protein
VGKAVLSILSIICLPLGNIQVRGSIALTLTGLIGEFHFCYPMASKINWPRRTLTFFILGQSWGVNVDHSYIRGHAAIVFLLKSTDMDLRLLVGQVKCDAQWYSLFFG